MASLEKPEPNNDSADYIVAKVIERLHAEGINYTDISWGSGPKRYTLTVKTAQGKRHIRFGVLSFNEYGQSSTDGLIKCLVTLLVNKLKYIS